MVEQQQNLVLSPYMEIYELVVPKDNLLLKDMNLLDMLITKTVRIALEKGIIKSKSIIVDATHTRSRYNQKTPRQAPLEQSKKLRRAVYEIDGTMKEQFPNKNTEDSLEKELAYCHALLSVIKEKAELCSYPKVREKLNLLEESEIGRAHV